MRQRVFGIRETSFSIKKKKKKSEALQFGLFHSFKWTL